MKRLVITIIGPLLVVVLVIVFILLFQPKPPVEKYHPPIQPVVVNENPQPSGNKKLEQAIYILLVDIHDANITNLEKNFTDKRTITLITPGPGVQPVSKKIASPDELFINSSFLDFSKNLKLTTYPTNHYWQNLSSVDRCSFKKEGFFIDTTVTAPNQEKLMIAQSDQAGYIFTNTLTLELIGNNWYLRTIDLSECGA